ncbi:hypothetical protein AMJ74_00600 [candidate division WOR_3 bacterium SM1_77]|uniref:DinB-like domain-containing protein n=1 Tax=candidate division WOR_3 bacterium SM1_77 TaxID=1703778 RepID=A0A0S8K1I6_UNCW3|nr:MAG: hypothetical protein AMJ74_00600 [candidate division WOR_3 bacterium SM1_77]
MHLETEHYEDLVRTFHARLKTIPETRAAEKPRDGSWSLKEIVGHLIDSAANNHQRFVRLQEGDLEGFPSYNNENWIRIQHYRKVAWTELIEFWYVYNRMLLFIVKNVDAGSLKNEWTHEGESRTLEWLISDYYRHMKWHIDKFNGKLVSA